MPVCAEDSARGPNGKDAALGTAHEADSSTTATSNGGAGQRVHENAGEIGVRSAAAAPHGQGPGCPAACAQRRRTLDGRGALRLPGRASRRRAAAEARPNVGHDSERDGNLPTSAVVVELNDEDAARRGTPRV